MEELWVIKDKLAREAGYDLGRFVDNLRRWEAAHPHSGRVICSGEELRQFVEEEESKRASASALALNDKPSRKD
jgi:hypothetical protein